MFDILVYLFENYLHVNAFPGSDQLARKLVAAGFEADEISEALEWLSGLHKASHNSTVVATPSNTATRVYATQEKAHFNKECQGFLSFLENAGVLTPSTRELIIDRTMALPLEPNLHRFKVIVLIVLWQQEYVFDTLILDELLCEAYDEQPPTLH